MNNFKTNNLAVNERFSLEKRYRSSRYSLLLLLIFTAVNIALLVSGNYTYFLFSATIPYALTDYGMFFTGMYEPEYYAEIGMTEFFDSSVFVFMLSIGILILTLYFLCWLLSSKMRKGWLITALVFFSLDTLAMLWLYGINMDMIFDVVFHIWVVVDLSRGIHAASKLKKLPAEEDKIIYDIPTETQE